MPVVWYAGIIASSVCGTDSVSACRVYGCWVESALLRCTIYDEMNLSSEFING